MVEKIKRKKRRKILVTGAGGMLGTALCPLLSRNYEVTGLDITQFAVRSSPALPAASLGFPRLRREASAERRAPRGRQFADFIRCDITDEKKTLAAIENAKPDLIIHAAAWTDVDGCEKEPDRAKKINEDGTANVALAASKLNIPLVYISTDYVFDGRKKTPYVEDDTPDPINVYARSKLEGEKKIKNLGKYIILRTSWLFGANGKNFVDAIIEKAKKEKSLKVVDDQKGCPTYTKDFAFAIKKLLDNVASREEKEPVLKEIYHIANSGIVSWFDYAKEIVRIAGIKNIELIPIKTDELDRVAKRPLFSALDTGKFEKAVGFAMRPWNEALAEYLRSHNEHKITAKKDKG